MSDEEFGDVVSEMLHRRARAHPDHPDPVEMTREHVRVARARRQKAVLSAAAVTAVMATVGVVWGTQAVAGGGSGGGGGGGPVAVGDGTPSSPPWTGRSFPPHPSHPVPSVPSSPSQGTPTSGPSSMPSTPPTGDGVVHGCDPTAIPVMTAKNFAWPVRGTLAGDSALGDALLQRATTLTGGKNAKLAYAGENAATRVVVVFVDPPDDGICGPGLRAVVFHGTRGTAPDQLAAQIGQGFYGDQMGFQWSERNSDGSLSLLLVLPQTVHTVKGSGTLGTKIYNGYTNIPTKDGSLLTTYAAGGAVPSLFDFTDPATGLQGSNHVNPVVTAPTAEALAAALGTDPSKLSMIDKSLHLGIAFKVGSTGPRFALRATDAAPGAENVYWSDFT